MKKVRPQSRPPDILILGSPRSGTTWLAKLFDSHERVLYRHEPDSSIKESRLPFLPSQEQAGELTSITSEYLCQLANARNLKTAGSFPVFLKEYRSGFLEFLRKVTVYTSISFEKLTPLHLDIPDLVSGGNHTPPVVLAKSVDSLGRAYAFSQAAPEMKIVHILRHPCGFVSSQMRGSKLGLMRPNPFIGTQVKMPGARKRGMTIEFLEALSLEEQLASSWMLKNEKVMEELESNPNYKIVVYDELCCDPEKVLRELFDFSGLDLSQQTTRFLKDSQQSTDNANNYFKVFRDPLKASEQWREELEKTTIRKISKLVADSMPGKLFF